MTISSEVSTAGPFNGNGATKIFPYGFRIVDEDHIRVVLQDIFGVSTDLSLVDGDYTVSGVGNDAGGNVTVVVAPATGQKLTLLRNPPFTQETDLANQGPYNAEVVEDRFDMMVMQIQTVKEITDRSIQVSPGQTPPSADLIEAAQANAESAASSAQSASESAALAGEFANNPEDVLVLPGLYSAYHFMKKAMASAAAAAAAAGAALASRVAKAGDTMTGQLTLAASTTSLAGLRVPDGVAPTAPSDGDLWRRDAGGGLFLRKGAASVKIVDGQTVIRRSIAIVADQKAQGAASQSITGGAGFVTRDLNTEISDVDNIVSITSNQFTPVYDCTVSGTTMLASASGQASSFRIFNVTDGVAVSANLGALNLSAGAAMNVSMAFFAQLVGGKTYRFETTMSTTGGVGSPRNIAGMPEIYLLAVLERLQNVIV